MARVSGEEANKFIKDTFDRANNLAQQDLGETIQLLTAALFFGYKVANDILPKYDLESFIEAVSAALQSFEESNMVVKEALN